MATTIGFWTLTKTDKLVTAALLPLSEIEETSLTLDFGTTGVIHIEPIERQEHSLTFVSVAPGGKDYTLALHELLPAPAGLTPRYSVSFLAASPLNGELIIDQQVSFRHPIEIHITNDALAGTDTFIVTYRLVQKKRHHGF